jgi:hypothetical protein
MRSRAATSILLTVVVVTAACSDDEAATTEAAETTEPAAASATPAAPATAPTADAPPPDEVLWLGNFPEGLLARFDLATGRCEVDQMGLSVDLIEIGLGHVWATDCLGGQLLRVDAATHEVTGRIDVGGCPNDLLVSRAGTLWLAVPDVASALEIDAESGEILSEIAFPLPPFDLAEGSLLVALFEEIYSFATATRLGTATAEDIRERVIDLTGYQVMGMSPADGVLGVLGLPVDADPTSATVETTLFEVDSEVTELASLEGFWNGLSRHGRAWIVWSQFFNAWAVWRDGDFQIFPISGMGQPAFEPPEAGTGEATAGGGPMWIPIAGLDPPLIRRVDPNDPATHRDHPVGCVWEGRPLDPQRLAVADPASLDALRDEATAMAPGFPMVERPEVPTDGVAVGPAVVCTESGFGFSNEGRTIEDVRSTWTTGGEPAPGLDVEAWIGWGAREHVIGRTTTDDDGRVVFPDGVSLDALEEPPAPGSRVTIHQTPVVEGARVLPSDCATDTDV